METNLFSVADKIIIITGGLGQLGSAYAHTLLAGGARVMVLDSDISTNRVERALGSARDSKNVLVSSADVTKRPALEKALVELRKRWGTPDGLINNAALDSPPNAPPEENGPFEDYPESSWDKVLDVNTKGVFLCSQVFGGAMAEAQRGSIVNIGSIYGLVSPDQSLYEYRRQRGEQFFKPIAYAASKSALLNMTRYLATYWGEKGVRVNSLTLAGIFNNQDPLFLKEYEKRVPLGRMATPEDYLGPVLFLLSGASRYMTGANMVVDGGWTAW